MAITLETIVSPGPSPIPNDSASAAQFANNYFKVSEPNISRRETRVITILGMVYILANAGPDYKANHRALIQDAATYTKGISFFDIFAAIAASSAAATHDSDATFPLDLPSLMAEGRDLINLSEDELDRIFGYLSVQLGL